MTLEFVKNRFAEPNRKAGDYTLNYATYTIALLLNISDILRKVIGISFITHLDKLGGNLDIFLGK